MRRPVFVKPPETWPFNSRFQHLATPFALLPSALLTSPVWALCLLRFLGKVSRRARSPSIRGLGSNGTEKALKL